MHNIKVGLFGVLEKKVKREKDPRRALNLCNGWSFTTNLIAHIREIWLVRKSDVYIVNMILIKAHLIHSEVLHRGSVKKFIVTLMYGFDVQSLRTILLSDTKTIYSQIHGAWTVLGDFNYVLNREERVGSKVMLAKTRNFKRCVDHYGPQDMKSSGSFYMWNNNHKGSDRVFNKLDKVLYKW